MSQVVLGDTDDTKFTLLMVSSGARYTTDYYFGTRYHDYYGIIFHRTVKGCKILLFYRPDLQYQEVQLLVRSFFCHPLTTNFNLFYWCFYFRKFYSHLAYSRTVVPLITTRRRCSFSQHLPWKKPWKNFLFSPNITSLRCDERNIITPETLRFISLWLKLARWACCICFCRRVCEPITSWIL